MVTRDRLEQLFTYSQGAFYWRKRKGRSGVTAGARAGYVSKCGYRIICIDYVDYFEHNLVWFMEHYYWPPVGLEIDHKDRCKTNNHPNNLRLGDRGQNCANQKIRADNKSGCRGVYWDAKRQKWMVQVTTRGKTKTLGRFDDLETATVVSNRYREWYWGEFANISK